MLQKGINLLSAQIVSVCRASIALSHIPLPWREVKVAFIPKPGKATYSEAKSFRPISLTSFILKALEKLIDDYVRNICLISYPLHVNQHAYQKGKSTDTALHQAVSRIEKSLNYKEMTFCASLDIQGAFDNTSIESVERACHAHDLPILLTNWFCNMLSSRIIRTSIGGTEVSMIARKGCPQGGCTSPLLWCMVVDSLIRELNDNGMFSQSYADDILILLVGKHETILSDRMQQALTIVEKWCIEKELTVNPSKTSIILFTNKRKIENLIMPRMMGEVLKRTEHIKYLGVWLDQKLNWKKHVDESLTRATRTFFQCRRVLGNSWGISPATSYWLYTVIIRTQVCYASLVWWPRCKQVTTQNALTSLQRLACIGITGVMRTTPTSALEVLLSLLPLHIFIIKEAKLAALRLKSTGQWSLTGANVGHNKIWNEMVNTNPNFEMITDNMSNKNTFNLNYSVTIPPREQWSDDGRTYPTTDGLVWYTDGSVSDSKSGAGVHLWNSNLEYSFSLGSYATVFQTEIFAISACADLISDMGNPNRIISICSDSQAALKALMSIKTNSKLVYECKRKLQKLALNHTIKLIWVPGHTGIPGNERADELARKGTSTYFTGPEPVLGLSLCHLKTEIEGWAKSQHTKEWRQKNNCRQTKKFVDQPRKSWSKRFLSMKRSKLKLIIPVLTGHCRLNLHLFRLGVCQSPLCQNCSLEEETVEHFLCICPSFNSKRLKIFGDRQINPSDLKDIDLRKLLSFVEETKRFSV